MRSGQALVLVMMVLAVTMTVGLSIISRSTNEVKVSTAQEESARALEAAEAGLEKALGGTLQGVSQSTLANQAIYVVFPTPTPSQLKEWKIPFELYEGQVATIDLRNFYSVDSNNIRLCWGSDSPNSVTGPALEASLIYTIGGEEKVGRVVLDEDDRLNSTFSPPFNPTGLCPEFKYGKSVDLSAFLGGDPLASVDFLMLRLRLYYLGVEAEPVAIVLVGNADLGRQGDEYIAIGTAGTSTQKLRGVQLNYDVPTVFDNAVFSGGGLVK